MVQHGLMIYSLVSSPESLHKRYSNIFGGLDILFVLCCSGILALYNTCLHSVLSFHNKGMLLRVCVCLALLVGVLGTKVYCFWVVVAAVADADYVWKVLESLHCCDVLSGIDILW